MPRTYYHAVSTSLEEILLDATRSAQRAEHYDHLTRRVDSSSFPTSSLSLSHSHSLSIRPQRKQRRRQTRQPMKIRARRQATVNHERTSYCNTYLLSRVVAKLFFIHPRCVYSKMEIDAATASHRREQVISIDFPRGRNRDGEGETEREKEREREMYGYVVTVCLRFRMRQFHKES